MPLDVITRIVPRSASIVRTFVSPGGLARARHTFAISATLDSAGGHWFGMDSPERETPDFTPIGIDYYDSSGVFVANFSPSNSAVKTGRILALTTDKTGVVWVGTTICVYA